MTVTLSIDDAVVGEATRRAEGRGTTLDRLVQEYLESYARKADLAAAADEFERLSRESTGNSNGWKFNRDEIYDHL